MLYFKFQQNLIFVGKLMLLREQNTHLKGNFLNFPGEKGKGAALFSPQNVAK